MHGLMADLGILLPVWPRICPESMKKSITVPLRDNTCQVGRDMIGPVGPSQRIGAVANGRRRADAASAKEAGRPEGAGAPGRGLVVVEPAARAEKTRVSLKWRARSNAAFLAQLLATRADMPHTRARRRAEPGAAIAAYQASDERTRHVDPGRTLSIAV